MMTFGQLVRPVNRKDSEAMVEAAFRGELHITFADVDDQQYFNRLREVNHDYTRSSVTGLLALGNPVTLIGTDKDAETLFALRFGQFERVSQI